MSDQVASAPDGGPVDVAVAPEADAPVAADPAAEDAPKKDESKDAESGVDPDPLPEGVELHES